MSDSSLQKSRKDITGFTPRLVVTGLDGTGKSTFTFDGTPDACEEMPILTQVTLWRTEKIPSPALLDSSDKDLDVLVPGSGIKVFIVSLKPDEELGSEGVRHKAAAETFQKVGISKGGSASDKVPGFHQTDSVDIITMISGEVHSIMETGETLLKSGDTLVQRGTNHAWANRGKVPAIFVVTIFPATR